MFELVVIVFVLSIYMALFMAFSLFILRVIVALKNKHSLKGSLAIILIPGSLGYYYYYRGLTPFKIWYQRLVIIMFIFTFIGSVYLAFLNIPQFAAWFFYG